jgi:lipoprotein-anchoring transpeptidase ErfK/SrfK
MVRVVLTIAAAVTLFMPTGQSEARSQKPQTSALTPEHVNAAELKASSPLNSLSAEISLKLQVLLDRAHFSPGEIDSRLGDNTSKAYRAFALASGLAADEVVTPDGWARLRQIELSGADLDQDLTDGSDQSGKPPAESSKTAALVQVEITEDDVRGPFARTIPKKMERMALLKALSYVSPDEKLGEKYHSNPELLRALNPGVSLSHAGERIWVPNVHRAKPDGEVERVVADKRSATVTVYGTGGRVLAVYPATVGSDEKPTPDGETEVTRVVRDPWYTYDPRRIRFKEVKTRKVLKIAPGPNNPVGLVWIALKKEGYGIHGAPEPRLVGKVSSHGCVRLTNWDALELASLAHKGTKVEFVRGNAGEARL